MNASKVFALRLKMLRKSANLSQDELAKNLFVTQQTIALWETGKRDLKSEKIISLAKFFNVSADYILGIDNRKSNGMAEIEEFELRRKNEKTHDALAMIERACKVLRKEWGCDSRADGSGE